MKDKVNSADSSTVNELVLFPLTPCPVIQHLDDVMSEIEKTIAVPNGFVLESTPRSREEKIWWRFKEHNALAHRSTGGQKLRRRIEKCVSKMTNQKAPPWIRWSLLLCQR